MTKTVVTVLAAFWLGACANVGKQLEPEPAPDAVLATRIKAALVEDESVDAAAIQVESERGRVTLRGFVETDEQRRRVETLARAQGGVGAVRNEIVLR